MKKRDVPGISSVLLVVVESFQAIVLFTIGVFRTYHFLEVFGLSVVHFA